MEAEEIRYEELETDDADLVLVAFGTMGRIAKSVVREARKNGLKLGLMRPISLWPFPSDAVTALSERCKAMLVVEMNAGQMVEDVRLAVEGRCPVEFYGRTGGIIPLVEDILPEVEALAVEQGLMEEVARGDR